MTLPFASKSSDWQPIRYTSEDCRKADRCGSCLVDILQQGNVVKPAPNGELWLTSNLFRHADEAQKYLALPILNSAEIGTLIDLESIGLSTSSVIWRRETRAFGQPGGAMVGVVRISSIGTTTPQMAGGGATVTECFFTRPHPMSPPYPDPAASGDQWEFPFQAL
ncbi:MAG: hypothetical protein QF898_17000 [SAR202 cluster bacterium]|jgi:hypothetical protein|nr:hypothetical protein [SAR202 cluster bacterium]MDP6511563.1 hypothetical protein [SAR202 cluster bacterium]